ncbi:hypothetical protein, partial [Corynebacterium phoceense]|uniref:hypothetical protein n=1 Tax=Corynebacterium phoceense TaxID=1686286 RepID=UPI00211CCD27
KAVKSPIPKQKNKPTPQPHRQTTNKAMTWHIQKLHKINNTDPTPDGAKQRGQQTITNKCDNRSNMHR